MRKNKNILLIVGALIALIALFAFKKQKQIEAKEAGEFSNQTALDKAKIVNEAAQAAKAVVQSVNPFSFLNPFNIINSIKKSGL